MADDLSKKGRHFYVPGDLLELVEQYAVENGIKKTADALKEVLSDHLRGSKLAENRPATRSDVKKILKRIELTNMILEPALLELLESSASSRFEVNSDSEKKELGRTLKAKYSELFRDLRDLL